MLHSSFQDRYKDVSYKITFYNHQGGWTTELHIEGLPRIRDSDHFWTSKEDAHEAARKVAEDMIDG
ncbi:hypothetical protein [Pseudomonas sp. LP_7_YM]|uniref:hypothetical protein n=1 Tax=Pseudomonas sp. LP_7_YM TaxID=2485137 RepID=UPI001060DD8F|nr:hypothetical protein [Pseudomonas sp. LP_7_YM]TDV60139.1 hypothetical protein EC915_113104 [Pseudomonas sp. LP_7_YM]